MKFMTYYKINLIFVICFFCAANFLFAQHRGDDLSYQGLGFQNENGVKSMAMGGAYTSISGDINSLFWNPAGLASISKIQITASANYYEKKWQENQEYRPNRLFVTLPFYLEGLYIPDPKNNGKWDYELAQDSNYFVNSPIMGKDAFGEDAADWQNNKSSFEFNSFAAAVPLKINDKSFVVSLGFNQHNVSDFDRNDSYLNPDLGYTYYGGDITRVNDVDTLNVQWSRYVRSRSGSIYNILGSLAYQLNEYVQVGARAKIIWGKTDDLQSLKRVGSFDLIEENRFRFSYEDVQNKVNGTSNYSGIGFSLGTIITLNRFRAGVSVSLPYTLERKWEYTVNYSDSISSNKSNISGTDKFKVPLTYSLGLSFQPVEEFTISFDYEINSYSNAEFTLGKNDSTFRPWVDQKLLRIGFEYKPFKFLSLLGGYRNIPQTFIPDGAAIKDAGPDAVSYTFGVSLSVLYGRFDVAYEIRRLKYYDSYFSNTNYNLITYNNLLFGYTFNFN